MEHRYIGKSGLRVSPICLGTMTFGNHCSQETAFTLLDKAYARGVNFIDTAEIYPVPPQQATIGVTEEIVGQWLQTKPRGSVILATKVTGAANGWFVPPVRHGLTALDAHHIEQAVEGSLRRLKTDYIDLYQMHWPDNVVPREESMRAFDRLVRKGKVRYLGTSNDSAYGMTKSNMISAYEGLARFEAIQNNFSLLNRRFLDSMTEMCRRESISLLPYSPMAGGVLSGKYNLNRHAPGRFTSYESSDEPRIRAMAERFLNDNTLRSTAQYMSIAQRLGVAPATLAIAWSMQFDFVASTIVGATSPEQLEDSLAALDITLDGETLKQCDDIHEAILYPMG